MDTPLEIIKSQGSIDLAKVYVAKFRNSDKHIAEFVDAKDPELTPIDKWVIIISTQFGCPIKCIMCDAGFEFNGNMTTKEMLSQIDYVTNLDSTNRLQKVKKLKIQFARMGEPSLNDNVLEVLKILPSKYSPHSLIPCIATTAPSSAKSWFNKLLEIRNTLYRSKEFQLQFSINSTDSKTRDKLMPVKKLSFKEINEISKKFFIDGTRKACLNFAITKDIPLDPKELAKHFDPSYNCVKITPLNPTIKSEEMKLKTAIPTDKPEFADRLCEELQKLGFDVILSIGDERENTIGSNCGMAVRKLKN